MSLRVNIQNHPINLNKRLVQSTNNINPGVIENDLVDSNKQIPEIKSEPVKKQLMRNFTEVDPSAKVTRDKLVIPDENGNVPEQEIKEPEIIKQPEEIQEPEQEIVPESPIKQTIRQPRKVITEVPKSKQLFENSFSIKSVLGYSLAITAGVVLGINLMNSSKVNNQLLH